MNQNLSNSLLAPLQAAEELIRMPAEALRQGLAQVGQTGQSSGLPQIPAPPELPRIFTKPR